MKRNWIRNTIGGLSFASALFIFQACYGTPQDSVSDLLIEGQVKSKITGVPIKGIKISIDGSMQFETTDTDGKFSFYTVLMDKMKLKFEDVDSEQNGLFRTKDTTITGVQEKVFIEITLDEN